MRSSATSGVDVSGRRISLAQLNTGWCTPGVHAPEVTGANRRQRDPGFTLRTAVRAKGGVVAPTVQVVESSRVVYDVVMVSRS